MRVILPGRKCESVAVSVERGGLAAVSECVLVLVPHPLTMLGLRVGLAAFPPAMVCTEHHFYPAPFVQLLENITVCYVV